MFEHFVFGAPSQTTTQTEHDSHPSPTDTSYPSPPSSSSSTSSYFSLFPKEESLNDVINKFSTQSLYTQSFSRDAAKYPRWDNVPLEIDEEMEATSYVPNTYTHSYAASVPTTSLEREREPLANRRLQRQLNVQLQSSPTHIRDINTLVSDMISSSSQCRLLHRSSRPSLTSNPPSSLVVQTESEFEVREISPDTHLDVDEGFCEDESLFSPLGVEDLGLSLRRASTPCGIRKYGQGGIAHQRSKDIVCVSGRMKVRCLPRMRKRRKVGCVVE